MLHLKTGSQAARGIHNCHLSPLFGERNCWITKTAMLILLLCLSFAGITCTALGASNNQSQLPAVPHSTYSESATDSKELAASGAVTAVVSPDIFCSFLPPQPGGNIGASESNAIVFCNKPSPDAPNAKIFPNGFIKTAHFAKGKGYVQVTGTINRTAYGLSASDGGGQYDSNGAPPHARVAGAKKFVNLVEPDQQDFCIRACTDPRKCNTSESTKGCRVVIPGIY